ncbi:carbohydrate ABC transporter membrane protein 1, CUT1 family [Faunimonas pinastri]|uniref:Carbohydrate ABC transporter membrane protein 1, CUT1 family n=1 Tax=Faunimonas pinastri TaxID=1855383 RepID=A0A1H9DXY6_9HYPH|nr:sugar ABC transporter permease [Faunimonas pinastri]SEQ18349.1 carbohydrate ABC transporter membrane protein 1, CUT1 family [Faunimonas pinastri]
MSITSATPGASRARLVYALFLALPVLLFAVFYLLPVAETILTSFQKWNGLSAHRTWVGLRNYTALFGQERFLHSLINNIKWLIFYLLAPPSLGLALALLLNREIRGETIFKVIFFLPYAIPPVAVASMWRWLYEPSHGLITVVMQSLGLGALAQNWLGNPAIVTYAIMGAALWWTAGFSFIVFSAGLRNLPSECIEAARLDGGNAWQIFWRVTFPLLWPSTIIVLGLSAVDAMRIFDIVWAMTNGGPAYASDVLATQMYDVAFGRLNMGQASAIAVTLLVMAAVFILPYITYMARHVERTEA